MPCPGSCFFQGSSSHELQTLVMDNAAALKTQRELTLTFPPRGLKTAGAALQQRAAHKAAVPQHKADPRQAVVAEWWLPSLGHGSNSLASSSSTQSCSLSPATACVLQSSSLNRDEQRESQLLHEHAAHTDHSHGPTPHCPTAESEGEEEHESVQNWITDRAARQLSLLSRVLETQTALQELC